MKLIDVYIQEVVRRLPMKSRQDIALELRSTIEDMLPETYNEEDVKEVLNELGSPVALANGYKGHASYLIGPRYFDVYWSIIKVVIPIVAIVIAVVKMTQLLTDVPGSDSLAMTMGAALLQVLGHTFTVVTQVFFGLTVSFAIIDRFDKRNNEEPLTESFQKWTASDLKQVEHITEQKIISKKDVFWRLLWTSFWVTAYFYANQLLGVYEGSENGMQFIMPALNQDVLLSFWPFVLVVAIMEVAFSLFKLYEGQWTVRLAISNAIAEIVSSAMFIVVLIAPGLINTEFTTYMAELFKSSNADWHKWAIGALIILVVFSTILNIFDGFKRALSPGKYTFEEKEELQ